MWLMNIFSYFILLLPVYINCEVSLIKFLQDTAKKMFSDNQGCHLKGTCKTFIIKPPENNTKGIGTLNFKNHLFNLLLNSIQRNSPLKIHPSERGWSTCICYQKSEIL